MYFIPVGMLYGANISVVECLFGALLPATLGNVLGGALGMGFVYWYLHDDSIRQVKLMNQLGDAMSERNVSINVDTWSTRPTGRSERLVRIHE